MFDFKHNLNLILSIILIMIAGLTIRRAGALMNVMRSRFSEGGPELTAENAPQLIDKWVKNNKIVLFMKGNP